MTVDKKLVLVTGASGFLGSAAAKALVLAGYGLIGAYNTKEPKPVDGITWMPLDITDQESVEALFQLYSIYAVIHIAGAIRKEIHEKPRQSKRINVWGTQFLIDAAEAAGVEIFVQVSSIAVYGNPKCGYPAPESHHCELDQYGMQKRQAEESLRLYTLPSITIIRPAIIYGPGDSGSMVVALLEEMHSGGPVHLRDADRIFDLVYVDDVVQAIVLAVAAKRIGISVYDVGSGKGISVREVFDILTRQVPYTGLVEHTTEKTFSMVANIDAIRHDLDWKPQVSLGEGITRTVDWYRQPRD